MSSEPEQDGQPRRGEACLDRDEAELKAHRSRLLKQRYSDDTTPEAQRMLNKIIREMPEMKRAKRHFDLNDHVRESAIGGYMSRNPSLSHREAKLLVIRDFLGKEMFDRYFKSGRQ